MQCSVVINGEPIYTEKDLADFINTHRGHGWIGVSIKVEDIGISAVSISGAILACCGVVPAMQVKFDGGDSFAQIFYGSGAFHCFHLKRVGSQMADVWLAAIPFIRLLGAGIRIGHSLRVEKPNGSPGDNHCLDVGLKEPFVANIQGLANEATLDPASRFLVRGRRSVLGKMNLEVFPKFQG